MLASALLATGLAAQAGDDCLAAPDHTPGAGGHWYYHLDRGRDRKCWYLVEPQARAPAAEPAQPIQQPPVSPAPSAAPAATPPAFESFFSTLSTGFSGQQGTPPPQPPASSTYSTQSLQPDDANGPAAPAPARTTRRTDGDTSPPAKLHHPAHPNPVQVADRPAAPSGQSDRDALFQEFLRWRARQ
ncbi:MAG TPA: hypothetical protein VKW08_21225 [Xanthobacteraceae bacterium]|nr:hypothetical protein [Xanthobacteraceae bacterium]